MDPRFRKFAKNLINYSINLQSGEKLLLEVTDSGIPLAQALIEEAYAVGGIPFLTVKNSSLQRVLISGCSQAQIEQIAGYEAERMRAMDAYISVRAAENVSEMSDVPAEKMRIFQTYWNDPVHSKIRVPRTKWCVMRYPNAAMLFVILHR